MTGFTLPTARPITQEWAAEFFDFDGDGINEYPQGFYKTFVGWFGHNGIDYGCFIGDAIEAVADGVVEYAGNGDYDPLMTYGGNVVRIRHDAYKVRSGYLHLSEVLVQAGDSVKKGQVIARSGDTGKVTAPHLHFEMYKIGAVDQNDGWRGRINPTPYLYGQLNSDYNTEGVTVADAKEIAVTTLKMNVAKYAKDGRTVVGKTRPDVVLGNLNQWVERILEAQAASNAKLDTLLKRQQANDSMTHAKLNANRERLDKIAAALPGIVDYDEIQERFEDALAGVSTVTVEPAAVPQLDETDGAVA